ncbi:hypothetical protein [Streptomyces sp. NPDC085479]|uniref:hypothetical protein n=1 Tax=Streptomyces sp. NPDC085479 TaxID=3365726 RepID=UPI0037D6F2B6
MALCRAISQYGGLDHVIDGLPLKLLIADRSTALVPVLLQDERQPIGLHDSPLLTGVLELSEAQWERCMPLRKTTSASNDESPDDVHLLGYATSACMARDISVKQRTAERRMCRIVDVLGTRTRSRPVSKSHTVVCSNRCGPRLYHAVIYSSDGLGMSQRDAARSRS